MQKLNISHEYEYDLWNEGVYDRQGLDIAWICACLNPLRYSTERKMNLFQKNFKLSPFHILYYHLADQCRSFFEGIINTKKLALHDPKVTDLLESPVSFSGNWNDFCRIVNNHGVVPLHAMLGGEIHAHRTDVLTVLSSCLAYNAKCLRDCPDSENSLALKSATESVNAILTDFFGVPPETFNWSFKTADGKDISLKNITPADFYKNCCGFDVNECAVVYDEAVKGHISENGNVFVSASRLAELAAENISQYNRLTVVGADTRHQANRLLGILDTDFNDNTSEFGSDVSMTKKDSFDYKRISVTDYLTLDGVQPGNTVPVRFKAQDSCGADTGADGHYTMNYDWFCKYVLFVVVDKKALTD